MSNHAKNPIVFAMGIFVLLLLAAAQVSAHCDTMNGPVVTAARQALATNDVNLVLIWVQEKDASVIKEAFAATMAVRALSPAAQQLADMYFFETLVRIHRAGEGVAYTGLKPAESEVEPGIAAADVALQTGSAAELLAHVTEAVQHGIHAKFENVTMKKNFQPNDVEAGREYVKAYVEFIHYVERLYQAVETPAAGHVHGTETTEIHAH